MIFYVGNIVSKYGNTPTSVEILGKQLNEFYNMKLVSDKRNKLIRLLDICFMFIKNRKRISLVLIDTYSTSSFYYTFIISILSNLFRIPYIPILRGGDLPNRLIKSPFMSKYIFGNASVSIAPSNYLFDIFKKDFNVKYIPNNIDLDIYPFNKRDRISPKILYVRAFSKVYNPKLAVYVVNDLAKKYPNIELCMVGPDKDGTLSEVKELITSLNLNKNIKITGKLSKKEWINLSKDYDIFLNTTNFDNMPVSVMEAMALGFPIISTNVGGVPFLIDNNKNGLLVEINGKEEIILNIERLLENNILTNELSTNARKKAEEFDWKVIKEKWMKLIDSIVDENTKR